MRDALSAWDFADAVRDVRTALAVVAVVVAAAALWWSRVQARQLALQGHRLRALADVAFDGLILARAGTVRAVNPALAGLVGIGAAWFEHRPLAALFDAAWESNAQ